MNASDTRNKAAILGRVKDLSQNKSLDYFSHSARNASSIHKKSVIIMDEVDGLGAGDRGGA